MKRLLTSYCYEMKKLLIARKGLAALILIVLLQIGIAFFARPIQNYYFEKELYESYTERYGGSYSNETQRLIYANQQAVKMLAEKYELTDSAIKVSAAPKINVQLKRNDKMNYRSYCGTGDRRIL